MPHDRHDGRHGGDADRQERPTCERVDHRRLAALELAEHRHEEAALVELLRHGTRVARDLGRVGRLGNARDRGEPFVTDGRRLLRGLGHGV